MATDGDISSQQAADVLGVSRQYMVRLLDRGEIPSFRVGSHRRVKTEDLATSRARRDQNRRHALATLTADAQGLGSYDPPTKFGPPRLRDGELRRGGDKVCSPLFGHIREGCRRPQAEPRCAGPRPGYDHRYTPGSRQGRRGVPENRLLVFRPWPMPACTFRRPCSGRHW